MSSFIKLGESSTLMFPFSDNLFHAYLKYTLSNRLEASSDKSMSHILKMSLYARMELGRVTRRCVSDSELLMVEFWSSGSLVTLAL